MESSEQSYGGHAVGEVIGNKRLAMYAGRNPYGHHLWGWVCLQCHQRRGPSTISHLKRSEMCLPCRRRRENNGRWLGHQEISGTWLYQYRSDAIKKDREWSVTAEQLWDLWIEQDGRCVYTGWVLTHGVDASLDRIDNTEGYVLGNVQWVHRDVNRMKSDFSADRFIEICRAVGMSVVV